MGGGCTWRFDCIQVALEGEVNSGRYIAKREASRYIIIWCCSPTLKGIVVLVFTKSVGKKMKKVTFCKLQTSLGRNFIYNLQTFLRFCQVHFYDFVANSG